MIVYGLFYTNKSYQLLLGKVLLNLIWKLGAFWGRIPISRCAVIAHVRIERAWRPTFSAASAEYASCCLRGWTSVYRTRRSVAIHPSTGRQATPTGRWSTVSVVSWSDSWNRHCIFSWAKQLYLCTSFRLLSPSFQTIEFLISNYLPKSLKIDKFSIAYPPRMLGCLILWWWLSYFPVWH